MTKADIIRFLEPFSDDIKIAVNGMRGSSFMLESAVAHYCMGNEDTKALCREDIDEGEGYVLIEEARNISRS